MNVLQILFLYTNVLLLSAIAVSADRVKIFIMIGQSNMGGMGRTEHLRILTSDPNNQYHYLVNDDSPRQEFRTRSDVRLLFNEVSHKPDSKKAVDLEIGYGKHANDAFGPEIGFGWVVGDAYDEPILLIKCTQGGSHLGVEWRSPSARQFDYSDPPNIFPESSYSRLWNEMLEMVEEATSNLGKYVPGYKDAEYDISGILWLQGWNDAWNEPMTIDYEENLVAFIDDLKIEFGANVPILVGELGQEGNNREDWNPVEKVRRAQERAVENFGPNVVFVPTSPYVISDGLQFDAIHHYYGRADTFLEIGYAFGREILGQLRAPPLSEDPIEEDPVEEDPVEEDPVEEDPVEEDPVEEDPVEEDPVEEDPVEEDPVEEDPVPKDPIEEDPVLEISLSEDSISEEDPEPEGESLPDAILQEQPIQSMSSSYTSSAPNHFPMSCLVLSFIGYYLVGGGGPL